MSERIGQWIQTSTSRQFWPLDARPEEVSIEDIAHALSHICRYVGHCREFFSVAQHSVIVSYIGPQTRTGLWWLLHDAPEAYIGDISRPLKKDLFCKGEVGFQTVEVVESRLMLVIAKALGLPKEPPWKDIKKADDQALSTEVRDLMSPIHQEWREYIDGIVPLEEKIVPLSPKESKKLFLDRFLEMNEME